MKPLEILHNVTAELCKLELFPFDIVTVIIESFFPNLFFMAAAVNSQSPFNIGNHNYLPRANPC